MRNRSSKIFLFVAVFAVILATVIYSYFVKQNAEPDTVFNALSLGSFQDYEIPEKIIEEIDLGDSTKIALYTTAADTIGIAYLDCSDIYEYELIERRSMPLNMINENAFSDTHFYKYNGVTVYYSLTEEETANSKEYTVQLNEDSNYTFYFSYSAQK